MFIAPNAATYATRVPYITPAEFKAHPTGVDVKQLVPGGSPTANDQALLQIIRRASSYADGLCNKILAATMDTQTGSYLVRRDGTVKIALDNSPIVAVESVTAGLRPGSQIALEAGPDWSLQGRILTVPTALCTGRVHATVRYINGWANTVLTAPAAAGATTVRLSNGLGVVPGLALSLSGVESSEFVTVADSYVPTSSLVPVDVPLAAPLAFSYALGDVCTAVPPEVKLAVIFLTAGIIKARAASALVMGSVRGQPDSETKLESGAGTELDMALEALSAYRRTI